MANDELDLITTQNNHDKEKADLAALIGLDPSVEYVFRDATVTAHLDSASAAATLAQYRDLAALTGRALQSRPDLEAARAGLESASSDVSAANGSYWPSLGLSGGYGNFSADADQLTLTRNYNLNAGVNMRWNLFDGFSRELAVEQANARGGYRGVPFELRRRWDDNPWAGGAREMVRLVYEERAWAVIGHTNSAPHLAEQVAAKSFIAVIAPVSSDPSLRVSPTYPNTVSKPHRFS